MSPWVTITAGLFGIIVGGLIGVVGKYLTDQRVGRTNRLLDEKLKHAVKFLSTTDQLQRAVQIAALARSLPEDPEHEDRQRAIGSIRTEAEAAYTALRLLVPTAADAARRYLNLSGNADPRKDATPREVARQTAEEAIRRALGVRPGNPNLS